MNEIDERYAPLQELWRSQETAPIHADFSRFRTEAEGLDANLRARNRREDLVAAALTVVFLLIAVGKAVSENAVSAGGALLVSGSMLWVRFAIRRWGRSGLTSENLSLNGRSFLTFYRSELVRQRSLVLHAWLWYVAPIFAGLSLINLGNALQRGVPVATWFGSLTFLVLAAITLVVVLLNLLAAWDLTRRITELRSVEGLQVE